MKTHDSGITRNKILKAAIKEFAEKGFDGSRMGSIAKRAGEHQALIHYHFKNKENLYIEVLKRIFGVEQNQKISIYAGKWKLSPSQKLYILIYFMTRLHIEAIDPDINRIFLWELAEGRRFLDPILREYLIPRQKILTKIIEEGIKKGDFESKNPDMFVFNLSSLIFSYMTHMEIYRSTQLYNRLYGKEPWKKIFDFTVEYIFKMLNPAARAIKTPELPEDLMSFLDTLLTGVIKEKDSGLTEEVIVNLQHILAG